MLQKCQTCSRHAFFLSIDSANLYYLLTVCCSHWRAIASQVCSVPLSESCEV